MKKMFRIMVAGILLTGLFGFSLAASAPYAAASSYTSTTTRWIKKAAGATPFKYTIHHHSYKGHQGTVAQRGTKISVYVRSGMSSSQNKWVSAHEGSHVREAMFAMSRGQNGLTWINSKLRKSFGGSGLRPIERAADAMAHILTGMNRGQYKKSFSSKQISIARDLLANRTPKKW